jgi:putative endonuclease
MSADPSPSPVWWLYVLVSHDGRRTYVGITLDVPRRLAQHNGERPSGARATRAGRPWRVGQTFGPYADRSEVSRAERALKAVRGLKRLGWAGIGASALGVVPASTGEQALEPRREGDERQGDRLLSGDEDR